MFYKTGSVKNTRKPVMFKVKTQKSVKHKPTKQISPIFSERRRLSHFGSKPINLHLTTPLEVIDERNDAASKIQRMFRYYRYRKVVLKVKALERKRKTIMEIGKMFMKEIGPEEDARLAN